jgi:hypothetical protein
MQAQLPAPAAAARIRLPGRAADLLAFALAALHFASFYDPELPIVTDVRFFLYFAWRIAEGAVPHLDLFDNKTQLASVAGALFYRVGAEAGVDPLVAIRAGELSLCTLGAMLLFWTGRRLGGGSPACGFLALLAGCSFGLLGALPAVGPLPKLLMSVLATAGALLAHDRRWAAAGACAGLAFLDWQIGALLGLGLLGAALASGPGRARAAARLALGALAATLPFAAWLASRGALREAWLQCIVASLSRASAHQAGMDLAGRLERIAHAAARTTPEQGWLLAVAFLGLALAPWWLARSRGTDRLRLLLPLVVHHVGIAVFALLDFQWYGDFFALLHAAAFGVALVWISAHLGVRALCPARARAAFAAALVAAAALAARPGPLRPELAIGTPDAPIGVTLSDQREVARATERHLGGRRALFLGSSELLYLMRRRNPLPLVYWNAASHGRYRLGEDESSAATAARLVREAGAEALFWRGIPPPGVVPEGWSTREIASASGHYRVRVYER